MTQRHSGTATQLSICEQAQLQSRPSVPTIAIVDDDSVQLSIYKKQFAKMGANVITFSSGEEFARSVGLVSRFLSHLVRLSQHICLSRHISILSSFLALFHPVCLSISASRVCDSYSSSESKFDLVVMDYVMPGMNGVETITNCESLLQNTSVCVLSGNSLEQKDETFLDGRGDCSFTRWHLLC